MVPLLIWLVVAVPVAALLYSWAAKRRARQLCAGLPGWPEIPLLGNALYFSGDTHACFHRLQELTDVCEERDLVPFQLWFGTKLVLMFSKPEDTKAVTNAFVDKPYYYSFGKEYLGDGLVTGPASTWKRNIKKLGGAFTGNIVDGFLGVFNAQAKKLVRQLKSEVGRPPFDAMQKYLAFTTLEAICQSTLGLSDMSDGVVTPEYYHAFNRTLELLIRRGFNVFLHPDFIYRLTPAYLEYKETVKVLHNVSWTVVRKRRQEWNERKKNLNENKDEDQPKRKFKAYIDILLEMSDYDSTLSDEQIRAEVDTVIVGGQETTATTLMFSMIMLGSHPNVQNKLYEEIRGIFGDSDRSVNKEDLVQMKYCEAVILEALRLFPPIPVVMRQSNQEFQIDNMTIPANAGLAINAWGAGRSRKLWGSDALLYRPERWLDGCQTHPAAFLPFSYGRRSCIGKKYAITLLKTVLATSVRELVFVSEADKLKFKIDIALKPTQGHLMVVHARENVRAA